MAIHRIDPTKNVRADRYDFRDREFAPRVTNLPPVWPPTALLGKQIAFYQQKKLVLDQGTEGACTGFGLSALIYCLLWRQWLADGKKGKHPTRPSPLMLYDLARLYDEWEGEDDTSGSSCRGAMKGWHKHGACELGAWPRDTDRDGSASDWRVDAIKRPLGAYYRVEARSIVDMQYAIHEIGAVYCSAKVHSGWNPVSETRKIRIGRYSLPVIENAEDMTGGHAFVAVGYTSEGFIVQNSWGLDWGKHGFAILPYDDWVKNGYDAWVAALAAPIGAQGPISAPTSNTGDALVATAVSQATSPTGSPVAENTATDPWPLDKAYEHAFVMGNNGRLLRRRADVMDADAALDYLVDEVVAKAVKSGRSKVAVIVHSGLLDEKATMARIRALGPWIERNNICPVFVVWRTSLADALKSIGSGLVPKYLEQQQHIADSVGKSLVGTARKKLQKQFDKAFEVHAEKAIGKATWSQIKENAVAATAEKGAMGLDSPEGAARTLLNKLITVVKDTQGAELHFVSHSAGAILLGNMIKDLEADAPVNSVTLYAPACTTEFACQTFGNLFSRGVLRAKSSLRVHVLSDEVERGDSVGAYGNSILYLVSRALEEKRKTAILGMAESWLTEKDGNSLLRPSDLGESETRLEWLFNRSQIDRILEWHDLARANQITPDIKRERTVTVFARNGVKETLPRGHSTFDNDIETIQSTIDFIAGEKRTPKVDDLREFNDNA